MKRVMGIILASLVALFCMQGLALALPAATVSVSPNRAQCGETVTVAGTDDTGELVSIKVTDGDGNIVYFGTARAGSDGKFQCTFKVPEMNPGLLTVTAGNGSDVAKAQVEVFIQRYCTVSFDKNGGGTNANPAKITVKEGALVGSKPAAPTRTGYAFAGWYREKECKTAWDFASDRVNSNITLYARWSILHYQVEFFAEDNETPVGAVQSVAWGHGAKNPAAPQKAGYRFSQWVLEGDDDRVKTSLDSVKENITAVASYELTKPEKHDATPGPKESASVAPTETMPAEASGAPTGLATATAGSPTAFPVSSGNPKGKVKVSIDTSELPEGTASIRTASGQVIDLSGGGGMVTVEVPEGDVQGGSIAVIAVDGNGAELGPQMLPVQEVSLKTPILPWFIVILIAAALVAVFLLVRMNSRRTDSTRDGRKSRVRR